MVYYFIYRLFTLHLMSLWFCLHPFTLLLLFWILHSLSTHLFLYYFPHLYPWWSHIVCFSYLLKSSTALVLCFQHVSWSYHIVFRYNRPTGSKSHISFQNYFHYIPSFVSNDILCTQTYISVYPFWNKIHYVPRKIFIGCFLITVWHIKLVF